MNFFIAGFIHGIILGNLVLQTYCLATDRKGSSIFWVILAVLTCAFHFRNVFRTKHK